MRIRARYRLTILGTLALVGLSFLAVTLFEGRLFVENIRRGSVAEMEAALRRQLSSNATATTEILASMLGKPLYRFELDVVSDIITPIRRVPNVETILVTDPQGVVVHDATGDLERFGERPVNQHLRAVLNDSTVGGSSGFAEHELFYTAQPIILGGELVGAVLISFRTDQLESDFAQMDAALSQIVGHHTRSELTKVAALLVGLVVLAVLIAEHVSRGMTRPIRKLAEVTRRIGRGEFVSEVQLARQDEIGELGAALARMSDDLRHAHADLVQARDKADLANRSKSEFLANVSHELRTPLNAIIGFAELQATEAHGGLGDPRYQEYAATILDNGRELLAIIDQIMEYTRPDTSRADFKPERLAIDTVVTQAIAAVNPQAAAADLAVQANVQAGIPDAWADDKSILRMLNCILLNAIKFTPSGGKIRVDVSATGGNIQLRVTDTGIGMLPGDIDRALEPLTQLDGTHTRQQGGIGLGLPLAKKLAEIQDGTLQIESAVGTGTTVTITLPAAVAGRAAA